MAKKRTRKLNPYPQGGMPSGPDRHRELPEPVPDKSWLPHRPGQGGEGLSDGYGGSDGDGTGPSGPHGTGKKSNRT